MEDVVRRSDQRETGGAGDESVLRLVTAGILLPALLAY